MDKTRASRIPSQARASVPDPTARTPPFRTDQLDDPFDPDATIRPPPALAEGSVSLSIATAPARALSDLDELVAQLPSIAYTGGSGGGEREKEKGSTISSSELRRRSAVHPDFILTELIGRGGMGEVHAAEQRSLQREVAIKMVVGDDARTSSRSALVHEARVIARLEHPNIVPIHFLGRDQNGQPALVMKRIEGVTWRTLLERSDHELLKGRDRLEFHLEVLLRVCDAVELAHDRGILHRDIKPENVVVGRFGEVYLVDWGVARSIPRTAFGVLEDVVGEEADGELVGTPSFMAPEMVLGNTSDLGRHTDVYLLGATLHVVITGKRRHAGDDLMAVLEAATQSAPVMYGPSVAELGAIANRATSRDPAARYPSATSFGGAIRAFLRSRALLDVTRTATEKLHELAALLARGSTGDEGRFIRDVHELSAGARFGFMEVLKADPDNEEAKTGLRECLLHLVRFEIEAGHATVARALVSGLSAPPASLLWSLEKLESRERDQHEAEQRLRHEHDPLTSRGARHWVIGSAAAVAIALSGYSIGAGQTDDAQFLAVEALIFAVVIGIAALTLHSRIKSSAIARRTVYVLIGVGLAVCGHRLVCSFRDTPTRDILATDLIIASLLFLVDPGRRLVVIALPAVAVAGAVAIQVYPAFASTIFVSVCLSILGVLAFSAASVSARAR